MLGRGSGRGSGRGRFGKPGEDFEPVPKERRARTIRRIAAFFGPYRPQVAVVVVAILVTSLLGLINPLLLGKLLDEVIIGHDFERLNLYVGLMIGIPILTGLLGVGQAYLNNVVGQNVMQDLRNALYSHLQRLPLRFFTETRTGEIQSRLANDVGGVQQVVTDTAANLTSNVAVAISTIAAMFLIDWRLTVMSLGVLPFFMYLTYRVGRVRREVSSETQKSLADLSAATEETLSVSGMLLSKTFGQQAAAVERFRGLNRRLAKLQIRQAMVGRWFFMIIGTIFSITPAFVYWLAGTLAANGDARAPSAGSIVAFTTLQSRLFFPLGALLNVQVEVQGSLALFDRIFEYLDLDPEIVDAPGRGSARPGDGPRQRPAPRCLLPLPRRSGARGPERGRERRRGRRGSNRAPARRGGSPGRGRERRGRSAAGGPRAAHRPSRSRSRTSTSRRRRASSSRWWVRRVRARRRRRTSSRGSTTSTTGPSRSTGGRAQAHPRSLGRSSAS